MTTTKRLLAFVFMIAACLNGSAHLTVTQTSCNHQKGQMALVEDRIRVVHPQHCKHNCPACARPCPATAIIFPKYDRSPINGGEERQERAIQLDTKILYAQALRERLAARIQKPITIKRLSDK